MSLSDEAHRTVLILGAGASCEYGFPCGPDLAREILDGLAGTPAPILRVRLSRCGFDDKAIDEFRLRLLSLETETIDRFLQVHTGFRKIGSAAIVATLAAHEKNATLRQSADHWYRVVAHACLDGDAFRHRWLRIISLNYDRSLEQYLFEWLTQGLNRPEQEAAQMLSAPSFIEHPHGQIGDLPWWPKREPNYCRRTLTKDFDIDETLACAGMIKVFGDPALNHDSFEDARESIAWARRICFLGFGYHGETLDRLGIAAIADKKEVRGTAYGLNDRKRREIERAILGIKLGQTDEKIVPFLARTGVLEGALG